MKPLTRDTAVHALQSGWGSYVERFRRLPEDAQQAFLRQQGYASLGDLLAHVIAWWQDAMPKIIVYLEDPQARPAEYDVDAFNAQAVRRFRGMSEVEMVGQFEATRQELIGLVESIPEWAFDDERVTRRLYAETLGHLEEHRV
jgi:hypothetical protein